MSENPQWTAEQIEMMKKGDQTLPRLRLSPAVLHALEAARAEMDEFANSDEGAAYLGDVFGGMGMLRVTEDGKIERIAPKDFRLPTDDKKSRD